MAEFETGEIPLDQVAPKYLGLSAAEASTRARKQTLPVPAYRAGSQKSPWLVAATDLAKYLDQVKEQARTDWRRIQAAQHRDPKHAPRTTGASCNG